MSGREGYAVQIAPAATRELRRLPPGDAAQTRGPILALGLEPRPYTAARVRGTDYWRIRIGRLRIVYLIDEATRRVVIVRVARRSESTYRKLRDESAPDHRAQAYASSRAETSPGR